MKRCTILVSPGVSPSPLRRRFCLLPVPPGASPCEPQAPVLCLCPQVCGLQDPSRKSLSYSQEKRQSSALEDLIHLLAFWSNIAHKLKTNQKNGCSPLPPAIPWIQFALWSNINNPCSSLFFMYTKSCLKRKKELLCLLPYSKTI